MSSTMRQRDWMFSSVVSGLRPANSSASVASVAFIISPIGSTLYFTPSDLGLRARVVEAHLRGVAATAS